MTEGFNLDPTKNIELKYVSIKDLKPSKRELSRENIEALKESISKNGLQNSIVITDTYEIIDGNHRIQALKELTFDTVSAVVYPTKKDGNL